MATLRDDAEIAGLCLLPELAVGSGVGRDLGQKPRFAKGRLVEEKARATARSRYPSMSRAKHDAVRDVRPRASAMTMPVGQVLPAMPLLPGPCVDHHDLLIAVLFFEHRHVLGCRRMVMHHVSCAAEAASPHQCDRGHENDSLPHGLDLLEHSPAQTPGARTSCAGGAEGSTRERHRSA